MSRHKVEISGVNTADIEVLDNDEMVKLFVKIKEEGDTKARDILINGNLKLVLSVLKKFQNRYDNLDDLFQVGCIGLLKAIDNFDLSHGVRFSTYAVPMIAGEIRRFLRDNNSLRISRSLKDIAYNALKTKEELINELNREVDIEEIAKRMQVDVVIIKTALEAMQDTISLFDPIYNDGGDTVYVIDQVSDDKVSADHWDVKLALEKGMKKLTARERFIIKERFFVGKTQMEVADEIGISQAQVSRLEKNAIKQIGDFIN